MSEQLPASPIVPIFPLPNVVFFPRTSLPLHIFEARYRRMVTDASADDGLIALALLERSESHDLPGSPPIHAIGTVGRIEDLEPLPDGRFNIRLVGLRRVRFEEVPSDAGYRRARCCPIPEAAIAEFDPAVMRAKLELLASLGQLLDDLTENDPPVVLDDGVTLEHAVNQVCATLPVEPGLRQGLLAESDLMLRQAGALKMINDVLDTVQRIKTRNLVEVAARGVN